MKALVLLSHITIPQACGVAMFEHADFHENIQLNAVCLSCGRRVKYYLIRSFFSRGLSDSLLCWSIAFAYFSAIFFPLPFKAILPHHLPSLPDILTLVSNGKINRLLNAHICSAN